MTFDEAQIEANKYANMSGNYRVFIVRRGLEYKVTQNLKKGWKYIATVFAKDGRAI